MARKHWHRMNGESGCIPDSHDTYWRKRDAIEWAETLFGDGLCEAHFTEMSKTIRSRGFDGSYCFENNCDDDSVTGGMCHAGASVLEIFSCTDSECNPDNWEGA